MEKNFMFNKFELIGAGISIGLMAMAIYLVQVKTTLLSTESFQTAQLIESQQPVVVAETGDKNQARAKAYETAFNNGNIDRMVIDDVKIGAGEEVKSGDTVSVHYIGTLQNGTEFDNSRKRGEPFQFKIGAGMVIKGWDEGLLGMKVGGQRVLVIPPDKAYGEEGVGPIPPNSTLVFAIELVDIR